MKNKNKLSNKLQKHLELINKTAKYPKVINDYSVGYLTSGIIDEYGEFIEKIDELWGKYSFLKKTNNKLQKKYLKSLYKEAGDVFWYIHAFFSNVLGYDAENIKSLYIEAYKIIEANDYNCKFDITQKIYDSHTIDSEGIFIMLSKLAGISKKHYRDNKFLNDSLISEICSFIIANILDNAIVLTAEYNQEYKCSYAEMLKKILKLNSKKLLARHKTNTINGDGDNREESAKVNLKNKILEEQAIHGDNFRSANTSFELH